MARLGKPSIAGRPFAAGGFLVGSQAMCAALNSAQQQAVSTLAGPLLVLAGAGTGKTRVVTFRIAELIRHGIAPERILAVTFTNKAAAEMQERVAKLLGKRRTSRPHVSTFHAHGVKILRRHIRRLGYPERFAIYDRGDQESIARSVLRDIRVGPRRCVPATCSIASAAGNRMASARRKRRPAPRPTKSTWPPWPIAATRRR